MYLAFTFLNCFKGETKKSCLRTFIFLRPKRYFDDGMSEIARAGILAVVVTIIWKDKGEGKSFLELEIIDKLSVLPSFILTIRLKR